MKITCKALVTFRDKVTKVFYVASFCEFNLNINYDTMRPDKLKETIYELRTT